jgi:Lrp/AsnC family leucine-responsive transcriptional regulator
MFRIPQYSGAAMTATDASSLELDRIDLKILNLLQRDNQLTNIELADAVAVSQPTCLRRVRRLREAGVIAADVSLVDPDKVGSHLMVIVEVQLRIEDRELMRDFERSMRQNACVMQCYLVIGRIDYVLVVCVRDMKAYERFASEALYSHTLVSKFTTLPIMNRVKFDTKLDLPFR